MNKLLRYLKKRVTLLFTIQLITLLVWYFFLVLELELSPKSSKYELSYTLTRMFFTILPVFIISTILFKIYDRFRYSGKTITFWALILIPINFIAAMITDIIDSMLVVFFNLKDVPIISKYIFFSASSLIIPFLLLSGLYFAVNYWINTQIQKENLLKSEALAHEAQLQMLRYQINPHFLFNALNTIRATIALDQSKARHTVTLLSDFFRYTLEKDQENSNTIGKEISAIKNYLDIQKIRFEEKLEYEFNIDPISRNIEIPFFIIHPLVENAVKYGIETSTPPLHIYIRSLLNSDNLFIKVTNNGSLVNNSFNNDNGTNTGIENIRKRLDLIYHGNYELNLNEHDNKVTAELIIKNIVNK